MEKKEVRAILDRLMNNAQTAKSLNQSLVLDRSLCSTATLYRRLSELQLSSIIAKKENYYGMTDFGRTIYKEYLDKINLILATKTQQVLEALKQGQLSTSELLAELSISPNELIEILKILETKQLVQQELKKPSSPKGGRPRKLYRISQRGKKSRKAYEKLKDKMEKT